MFARMVTCNVAPGKRQLFTNALNEQILNILRNEKGFVDVLELSSESDPDKGVAVSIWNAKEDADRYARNSFSKVLEIIRPLITGTPTVENFTVDTSTFHKIAAGKAA